MNKLILSLLFVVASLTAFAQDLSKDSHALASSSSEDFLYADWLPATITLNTGEAVKAQARYNVAKQEMEVKQGEKTFVVSPKVAKKVVISNLLFVPIAEGAYVHKNKENDDFVYYTKFKIKNHTVIAQSFKKSKENGQIVEIKKNETALIALKDGNVTKIKEVVVSGNKNNTSEENIIARDEVVSVNLLGGQESGITASNLNDALNTIIENGESVIVPTGEGRNNLNQQGNIIQVFDNREKKLVGSPYLNKDFTKGTVYLAKEPKKIIGLLRYNVLEKNMELSYNNKIVILDPSTISKIKVNDKTFIIDTDVYGNSKYYQFIGEIDNNKILKFYTAFKEDAQYEPGFSVGNPKEKIKITEKLFISNDVTGSVKAIKNNKKALLALFGKKKKEIEKYIKQNNINIKKSENLIKLIKYYNTL